MAPRRTILRPPAPAPSVTRRRRLERIQAQLRAERAAMERWWKRLRRALNAIQKHQRAVRRLERQTAQLGDPPNGQGD